MLIVLKGVSDCRTAMLVDRVSEILSIPETALLPVAAKDSFNGCAEAGVSVKASRLFTCCLCRASCSARNVRPLAGFSGRSAAAPAELGNCEPMKSAQAYDELICDPLYPRLKQHVLGSTGWLITRTKDTELAHRMGGRLACLGLRDCSDYLNMLCEPLRGPAELDALIAAITIGETYFFRHQEHFDSLRDLVLPGLAAQNRAHRSLRIWSAGCADGPEPYSLAILLKREMAHQFGGWQTTILGTDINRHCLARTREGKFEEWAFRSTPEDVRRSCFQSEGKRWGILPEYREGVSFQYHNLVEHAFPCS